MSRIGKHPITIPAGVKVAVDDKNLVTVTGPKGTLSQQVNPIIKIEQEGNVLTFTRPSDINTHRAMHGLYRTLVNNMIIGTTEGFSKNLELVGTGYRASAEENGKKLVINVGYSNPVEVAAPENITFETPVQTKIVVKGINKQQVGNLAADIRAIRSPEPYHGKGIRYEGEKVTIKEGKAGKK